MNTKPKIGLLPLAADWFWRQNIQGGGGRYRRLPGLVERDVAALTRAVSADLDIVSPGLVHTVPQAAAAARTLRAARIDLLLVCSVIWSEDQPLLRVLRELPEVPVLVWCYAPTDTLPARVSMTELFRRSGPVGALQHSAPLKRMGRRIACVCGAPTERTTLRQIRDYAEAARVAHELRRATIGLLPGPCAAMTGTITDATRLRRALGPTVKRISVRDFAACVRSVGRSETAAFVRRLTQRYRVAGVGRDSLFQAARASLGLARLAETRRLDALAINDLEPALHAAVGVRPFLEVPEFFARGRVLGMEGDLTTTVGLLIARRLAAAPPMFTELFAFDRKRHAVLAGHAGMHDLRLAESARGIRLTPDYEYCEANALAGAWLEFRAKPGWVTLMSLFCDVKRFRLVLAGGRALAGGPRLEGFAHALVRLDRPVDAFFRLAIRSGMTQHWVVVHEDIRDRLRALAAILDVECVDI